MRLPFVGKPYVSALITDTVSYVCYRVLRRDKYKWYVSVKNELLYTVLRKALRRFLSCRYRTALGALIRRCH